MYRAGCKGGLGSRRDGLRIEVMLWVGNTLDKARETFDAETVDGFLHKLAI